MNAFIQNRSLFLAVALTLTLNVTSHALTEGDYTYTVTDNVATITDFNSSYSGALSITNTLGEYQVTRIGDHAFANCGLTSVTIPNSVTNIVRFAFYHCTSLTNVTIGNGVTSIRTSTFEGCGLTSITIPNSVTNISNRPFDGCSSLTSITIPDGVASIGNWAFRGCSGLSGVYFKGNAPKLAGDAFCGDTNTVYYLPTSTGFGTTFGGRPTALWTPAISATVTNSRPVEDLRMQH